MPIFCFLLLLLLGSHAALAGQVETRSKDDLAAFVAGRTGLSPAQAGAAVDAVFEGITRTLVEGGEVRIARFGTFLVKRRRGTESVNPDTGVRVVVPARSAPVFKAGKALFEAVRAERTGAASGDPGRIVAVTDSSFETDVLGAPGPVLVWFTAEWSGPDRMLRGELEDVAAEFAGRLAVAKFDIDENPEMTRRFDVRAIPTLMLFVDGAVAGTKVGLVPKDQLVDWVVSLL